MLRATPRKRSKKKCFVAKLNILPTPRLPPPGTTVFSTGYANAWLMHALKKLPATEADVAEAAEWYETQRPGLGERFISTVQSADKLLLANPLVIPSVLQMFAASTLKISPTGYFSFFTMT
jgi:hypothetical protein